MHIAISTFKTKPTVSDDKVLSAFQRVQDEYLTDCPGFVSRELLKAEGGSWMGIIRFDTTDNARAALRQLLANPAAQGLSAVVDVTTTRDTDYELAQEFRATT